MPSEVDKYVWDAKEAGRRILRFCDGKSFAEYQADEMLRAAVERQFTILGEALGRLRHKDPALAARISDVARAIALRNVLVHAYAEIDDGIVWGVVSSSLGKMIDELDAL